MGEKHTYKVKDKSTSYFYSTGVSSMSPIRIPYVSIIMPVYNCIRYVQESIESILGQTYADWEFIIIDDGSTDGTRELLNNICKDPRIKIYNQDNRGIAKSLNTCLRFASGRYIARQDADDISFPTRLAKQVAFLDSMPECGFVGTWAQWTDEDDKCIQILDYPIQDDEIQLDLLNRCCFTHGSVTMRKTALDKVGGYCEDFQLAQDYDLWLRIAERFKAANIPEVLYIYRKVKDSISCQRYAERQKYMQLAVARAYTRRKIN